MEGAADIGSLSALLTESREALEAKESSEHFQQKPGITASTSVVARRGGSVTSDTTPTPASKSTESKKKATSNSDIWGEDEVPTEEALLQSNDGRPAPRYEFSYKQSVGTEDTFLGLGDKTPLTSDCTHIVVKIHFPGSSMKELELDVKKNRLRASSRTHRLFTYLPVDVDDVNGKAIFDNKKEVLTITLPIIRDII